MDQIKRIRVFLKEYNFDGILLGRRDNFTWISQGADNHVLSSTENGVAYYVVLPDQICLIADSSDLFRMAEEQNPLNASLVHVPWYTSMDSFVRMYTKGRRFASDTGIGGTTPVTNQLVKLRMKLNEQEIKRYKEVGRACAQIVEKVCKEARPGDLETDIERRVKTGCLEAGISPDCVLAGSDERLLRYRHPMPAAKPIENSLMVVLGGQKYGLYISLTRMVWFQEVPKEVRKRYEKTAYIFACMQTMMTEGMSYQEYFKKICSLYEEAGYKEEWKKHHQGGPAGYSCREFVVAPETAGQIHTGQAYAWNPTIEGTKCEETTFLYEDSLHNMTDTGKWPRFEVGTPWGEFQVADILQSIHKPGSMKE